MAQIKIFKETAVPATLEANAVYLVGPANDASLLEIYVTNAAGTATRKSFGPAEAQILIDAALTGISGTEIVGDIAARDALTLTANAMVLVEDASADEGVDAGAALYTYKHETTSFNKIAEYESLDVTLTWASLTDGPNSTPLEVDQAVSDSHTHGNKTQLDKVDEDADSCPTYAGTNFVMAGAQNW